MLITNLNNGPKPDVRYMFEIMGKKAGALHLMTQNLGHAILATNELKLSDGPLKMSWVSSFSLIKNKLDSFFFNLELPLLFRFLGRHDNLW